METKLDSRGWKREGVDLIQGERPNPHAFQDHLAIGVYVINVHPLFGHYVTHVERTFSFPYKLYDIKHSLIDRIEKTYRNTSGNLGVLYNGPVGSGKTVSAKVLSNKLKLPVLILNRKFENQPSLMNFLSSIQQDFVLFMDEYEKIYNNYDDSLLAVMDGVMSTEHRRVFLLTTNSMHVSSHMMQRPSRIRYIVPFGDLSATAVEEIVDDLLVHTSMRRQVIDFISKLSLITVDLVKSIVHETNIHAEPPQEYGAIFNVRSDDPKYFDVYLVHADGAEVQVAKEAMVHDAGDLEEGNWMHIDRKNIGVIVRVIDDRTVEVKLANGVSPMLTKSDAPAGQKTKNGSLAATLLGDDPEDNDHDEEVEDTAATRAIYRIAEAKMVHRSFKHFDFAA